LSQTIFFAGAVIGTLFFGWIIDHYGRVWTMMIATLNILVTGIATPFSNGFLTFAVFRFLMGMSYPTFFLCGYMLGEFENTVFHGYCTVPKAALPPIMLFL
jgi:MFS family permease